jgi:hypothetical protein
MQMRGRLRKMKMDLEKVARHRRKLACQQSVPGFSPKVYDSHSICQFKFVLNVHSFFSLRCFEIPPFTCPAFIPDLLHNIAIPQSRTHPSQFSTVHASRVVLMIGICAMSGIFCRIYDSGAPLHRMDNSKL